MNILSNSVALPSRRITNDDVLQDIEGRSSSFSGDLEKTIGLISRGLRHSGSGLRTWKDQGEDSLEITLTACRKALSKLDGTDRKIDLVICAGLYGELFEPASANLIANGLGLCGAEAFDMREACDGWMKAAKVAYSQIETGFHKRVLVVNAEFPMTPGFGIYPHLFALSKAEELEWRFPAFTLGEAATATVFGPDPTNGWKFTNVTRNDLYDLCTITMPWGRKYSPRVAQDGPGLFTSYGADLRKNGFPLAVDAFKNSGIDPDKVDILFTHSSSKTDWREGAKEVGLGNRIYDLYSRCGNVVTAAVPAAMALAEDEGLLKRGAHVATWVASAGMSFSTAEFTY